MLLTAEDDALAARPSEQFARAWLDLAVVSLLWGMLLGWLWSTCWTFFGDYTGVYLVQVAVVGSVMVLWLVRRPLVAFCSYLSRDVGGRAAAIAAVTIALFMLLLCIRPHDYRELHSPQQWAWLYPLAVQRVLLLMPLWGAWAMIILTQFCRPCERTEPAVAAFARGCGAFTAAALMALPLGLSFVYLHYLGWWRPAVPLAAALLGGLALCRLDGGLTRRALLASNFLTQLAFLVMYLVR
ncbi:MAG: hypothetical protein BWX88_04570 [Planctomycetes bacterium ADurb.Bin126]|nr:MAG: hypothetical protein BWX88_04570 [Planctomycetes bacterium ADurb.Bin126]HOD84883.1 hypothetical protein [Phycisphaerae bacterium]HQL75172.1 hypothetical protein [Phycisphaerae bacterium]